MAILAVTLVILASADDVPPDDQAPPDRIAVWVQPVGVAYALHAPWDFYVPVGVNLPWGERHSAALEFAFLRTDKDLHFASTSALRTGVVLAAGPSFQLTGERRLHGLFVHPKLIAAFSRNDMTSFRSGTPRKFVSYSAVLHLGIDVGVHLKLGPVYVAPVIGLSAGYSVNAIGGVYPGFSSSEYLTTGSSGDVNLTLLRVGAFF